MKVNFNKGGISPTWEENYKWNHNDSLTSVQSECTIVVSLIVHWPLQTQCQMFPGVPLSCDTIWLWNFAPKLWSWYKCPGTLHITHSLGKVRAVHSLITSRRKLWGHQRGSCELKIETCRIVLFSIFFLNGDSIIVFVIFFWLLNHQKIIFYPEK